MTDIERIAREALRPTPLFEVTAAKLQSMAITGEGDSPDPFMDAIVEMGHRSERQHELARAVLDLLEDRKRVEELEAENARLKGELEEAAERRDALEPVLKSLVFRTEQLIDRLNRQQATVPLWAHMTINIALEAARAALAPEGVSPTEEEEIDMSEERRVHPTASDLEDPEFEAVFQAMRGWDIERQRGEGYAGANGTDVMTILNAIRSVRTEAPTEEEEG